MQSNIYCYVPEFLSVLVRSLVLLFLHMLPSHHATSIYSYSSVPAHAVEAPRPPLVLGF